MKMAPEIGKFFELTKNLPYNHEYVEMVERSLVALYKDTHYGPALATAVSTIDPGLPLYLATRFSMVLLFDTPRCRLYYPIYEEVLRELGIPPGHIKISYQKTILHAGSVHYAFQDSSSAFDLTPILPVNGVLIQKTPYIPSMLNRQTFSLFLAQDNRPKHIFHKWWNWVTGKDDNVACFVYRKEKEEVGPC